jgi:hypothetical protein
MGRWLGACVALLIPGVALAQQAPASSPQAPTTVEAPPAKPAEAAKEAGEGDPERLKALVEGTGLKHTLMENGTSYAFAFRPREARDREAWVVMVQYSNPSARRFVLVFAVLLKLPDGELPKRLLKGAMELNGRSPGSKLAWDRAGQSIDVQYEIPVEHATPAFLAWAVRDVAATCDSQYAKIKELIED